MSQFVTKLHHKIPQKDSSIRHENSSKNSSNKFVSKIRQKIHQKKSSKKFVKKVCQKSLSKKFDKKIVRNIRQKLSQNKVAPKKLRFLRNLQMTSIYGRISVLRITARSARKRRAKNPSIFWFEVFQKLALFELRYLIKCSILI